MKLERNINGCKINGMTKIQRREIYWEVFFCLEAKCNQAQFMCLILRSLKHRNNIKVDYPELYAFSPRQNHYAWYYSADSEIGSKKFYIKRQESLLKAIELTYA